jgi:hypothetical protein
MRTQATFSGLSLFLLTATAWADPPVEILDRGSTRVVLDGVLREWSNNLTALDDRAQVERGAAQWRGPDDASVGFAVARDDTSLWFVAEVRDDRVVRSRQHRAADDTLSLTLAANAGGRWITHAIEVQPGEPGAYAGVVRFEGGAAIPGAQVVEAPLASGGFTVEVKIPWAALPGVRDNLDGLRARVAYSDADVEARPAIESVLSNGPGDARHPESLPLSSAAASRAASAVDLYARFVNDRGLAGVSPLLDRRINVAGGNAPERVVVFPRYAMAYGPDIAAGQSYVFIEFPARGADDVIESSARDVTGDGLAEVLLRLRTPTGEFDREVLHVYQIDATGALQRVFVHELARVSGANRVADQVAYESGGRIRVGGATATGFTRETYPAAAEAGVEPTLTPWGTDRARFYRWDTAARRFVFERAEPNPAAVTATTPSATPGTTTQPGAAVVQPAPDVEAVLRLFRQRENLAADARPAFREAGDAEGDATPEQFYVYGRFLVVVGPRFMGGTSYYSMSLPVNPGDDVAGLQLADVTDDGHVEAIVRVRRRATTQVRGAQVATEREMVFVYSIEQPHRGRVFGAELVRRAGRESIVNELVLPRGRRGNQIAIEARNPVGWTRETYPFNDQAPQGYEPLLLPWAGARRVVYRWTGSAMTRVP